MAERPVTPHQRVERIFTGLFDVGPPYDNWRPAGTDDFLLIYTVAGRGRFGGPGGAEMTAGGGDLVLIRPGTPHDYGIESTRRHWHLLWAHFRADAAWLDLLDWPAEWPGVMRLRDMNAAAPLFHRTHELALVADPLRDRLAMNALEALLLACERSNPRRQHHQTDARLRQTIEHIARHLDRPLTIDDLAAEVGLSGSRLAHLFREAYAVPPMQYVESRRIERAKQLLRMTSLSVKEIAQQVGYASPFYFSLRFKKTMGKNPSAFREDKA